MVGADAGNRKHMGSLGFQHPHYFATLSSHTSRVRLDIWTVHIFLEFRKKNVQATEKPIFSLNKAPNTTHNGKIIGRKISHWNAKYILRPFMWDGCLWH